MREIKFRGFRNFEGNILYPPDKRWIYGYFIKEGDICWIRDVSDPSMTYVVIPESIRQYTGLKDKNGKEVYEGDIYKQPRNNSLVDGEVKEYIIGDIRFDNGIYWCMEGDHIFNRIKWTGEVIGNIYENPELLEVK